MGLATAYQVCKDGARVLVVERGAFMHEDSSSGGATRQFRLQYAEEYMARMVQASIPLWNELQGHTDKLLRSQVGSLWFGDPETSGSEGQINGAIEVMTALKIPFERLTAGQIEERFAFRGLPEHYRGFLQADGGTIHVPATLRVMLAELRTYKQATLLPSEAVTEIRSSAGGVTIATASGARFSGGKLVLTAGPYAARMLAPLGVTLEMEIWQMASCYFSKLRPDVDYPSWFAFEAERADDPGLYYGFEEVGWSNPGTIRVAPAFANHIFSDPDERAPRPDPRDIAYTERWVAAHMPGLDPRALSVSSCLAALPRDDSHKMFLDFAPGSVPHGDNIVVFAGGWAFKFVPLVGRICADLALHGRTAYDISHFAIGPAAAAKSGVPISRRRRLVF